jgi:hypothetical protein
VEDLSSRAVQRREAIQSLDRSIEGRGLALRLAVDDGGADGDPINGDLVSLLRDHRRESQHHEAEAEQRKGAIHDYTSVNFK